MLIDLECFFKTHAYFEESRDYSTNGYPTPSCTARTPSSDKPKT